MNFKILSYSLFLFFLILFSSLELASPLIFYGTQLLGAIFLLVVRFLLFPKIDIKTILIVMILFVFWELLILVQSQYTIYNNLFLVSQRPVFIFLNMLLIYDFIKKIDKSIYIKVVNFYIILLSFIIFFQFFGFYFIGISPESLDASLLIGGEASRSAQSAEVYRAAALMPEPAIFCGVQFALLVIQYILDKNNSLARFFGVVSLLLSMAFVGIILVSLFLIIVFTKKIKNIFILALSSFLLFPFFMEAISERFLAWSLGDDGSNTAKVDIIYFFINNIYYILFGYGSVSAGENMPRMFEAASDITFYLTVLGTYGVFVGFIILITFFLWISKSKYNFREKLLILLVLVKLTNPGVLFFSCFIFMILAINYQRKLS